MRVQPTFAIQPPLPTVLEILNLTSAALKIFLALDPCDMRKSFNGLHTLAADQL